MSKVSKYSKIWQAIKESQSGVVSVAVLPELHSRVIKAVLKRKDLDLGYKVIQAESGKAMILRAKSNGSVITFTLLSNRKTQWDL